MAQANGLLLAFHSFWSQNCFQMNYQNYPKIAVSSVIASPYIKYWKNVISAFAGISTRCLSCIPRNNASVPYTSLYCCILVLNTDQKAVFRFAN